MLLRTAIQGTLHNCIDQGPANYDLKDLLIITAETFFSTKKLFSFKLWPGIFSRLVPSLPHTCCLIADMALRLKIWETPGVDDFANLFYVLGWCDFPPFFYVRKN